MLLSDHIKKSKKVDPVKIQFNLKKNPYYNKAAAKLWGDTVYYIKPTIDNGVIIDLETASGDIDKLIYLVLWHLSVDEDGISLWVEMNDWKELMVTLAARYDGPAILALAMPILEYHSTRLGIDVKKLTTK